MREKKNNTWILLLVGALIAAAILSVGAIWIGNNAGKDTEEAVHSVSLLYLDELAGRREEVVEENLKDNIREIYIAIELMTEEDLRDMEHLQAYQARIKSLFQLEKFAFVDRSGLIYTSQGTQTDIDQYTFDFRTLSEPEVSIKNIENEDKKVVIAVPVEDIPFNGQDLNICFMEIDMDVMLEGLSLQEQGTDSTYCNIYAKDGTPLSNVVLGGLAKETNLLEALQNARFDEADSLKKVTDDFTQGRRGVVTFTYNGIHETLSYVPVDGTDWMLTYLIREGLISDQIRPVTDNIVRRSLLQSVLVIVALLGLFAIIIIQTRRSSRFALEREKSETESRIKHEELERRLELQEKLLDQERHRAEQDRMITALSSDYWSVYYLDLDKDEGVCYQAHEDIEDGFQVGDRFRYMDAVTAYAEKYITEPYLREFLAFVRPEAVRKALQTERVISYRYIVSRHGRESYEMVRFAGVRHPEDRDDGIVHAVGACFANVDKETRRSLEQSTILSEALTAAEEASKAKTAFLSNMSHEIRTPMNAIIGLDSIALEDPDIPDSTRDYLEKIGDSADHLLQLINDILDMSRIESGRMVLNNGEFSLRKLIDAVDAIFSGQCAEKGLEYTSRIIGPLDEYYFGDDVKLRQVLINILGNAVKFTPEGGRVDFTTERTARYDGKTTLQFKIRDTGIGISREYLPHIFDTFSQENESAATRYGSSGLGLAITKNIVEMMNGNIEVESEKGEGTTFTVVITLTDSDRKKEEDSASERQEEDRSGAAKKPQSGTSPEREAALAGRRILLAEDVRVNAEIIIMLLKTREVETDLAENGRIAVDMFSSHPAGYYDAIFMDMRMPEMDGLEATRTIRAMDREDAKTIPIIALTANAFDEDVQRSLQAGLNAHLSKPVPAKLLFETLTSLLEE